jgi:hypothetical protein
MDPSLREYRLAKGDDERCWPYLDQSGAFHGAGTPLLRRRRVLSRVEWEPRPQSELEALFSVGYDQPQVDASGWCRSLRVVANALNEGETSLAATALVLSRIPPLPSRRRADAMALADEIMKFDAGEPRIPKHQSGGGRWTYGSGGADSEEEQSKPRHGSEGNAALEDVVYSREGLSVWRILRDSIERSGADPEVAANIIAEILENVSPSELPAEVRSAMQPPKPLSELRPPGPFTSFDTWRQLESYIGKAPPGYEWHHIVEQSVASEHPEDPGINRWIQNTDNVVLIPSLRHLMITADMNSHGVRAMIHLHNLEDQYEFGLYLLKKWGAMK